MLLEGVLVKCSDHSEGCYSLVLDAKELAEKQA